jgi:Cu-processing system permease protein
MWSFLVSAWRSGLRSRSIQGVLVLGVLLVGVAYLSASFSPRQPRTVALDVGLSGLRVSLILFALFWVQELVGREIERRTVLFSLTYPVARGNYVLGRYLGVIGLLALAALLLGLLLWVAVRTTGGDYQQAFVRCGGPAVLGHRGGFVGRCGGGRGFCAVAGNAVHGADAAAGAGAGLRRRR